jgi:hypothetical protein
MVAPLGIRVTMNRRPAIEGGRNTVQLNAKGDRMVDHFHCPMTRDPENRN